MIGMSNYLHYHHNSLSSPYDTDIWIDAVDGSSAFYNVNSHVDGVGVSYVIAAKIIDEVVFEPLSQLKWECFDKSSLDIQVLDDDWWKFAFEFGNKLISLDGKGVHPDKFFEVTQGLTRAVSALSHDNVWCNCFKFEPWWLEFCLSCVLAQPGVWDVSCS